MILLEPTDLCSTHAGLVIPVNDVPARVPRSRGVS